MRPREVFLSHSHQDKVFARELHSAFRGRGINFWFAPYRIVGSQRWHDEIGRALQRCDWFLIVLTPSAVRSKWVKHELLFALNEERYEDRIVPVLRKDCRFKELSWTLGQIQFVDFRRDFEEGCRELCRAWSIRHPVGRTEPRTVHRPGAKRRRRSR